jgi:hypothetical protein
VPEADILRCSKERRYSITSSTRASVEVTTLKIKDCGWQVSRDQARLPRLGDEPNLSVPAWLKPLNLAEKPDLERTAARQSTNIHSH